MNKIFCVGEALPSECPALYCSGPQMEMLEPPLWTLMTASTQHTAQCTEREGANSDCICNDEICDKNLDVDDESKLGF